MANDFSNGYEVDFHIQHWTRVLPQRCKVERALLKEVVQTHRIEGITAEEAPVAMRMHWAEEGKGPTDYRLHHGELYKACDAVEEGRVLCPQFVEGDRFSSQLLPLPEGHSFKEKPVSKDLPEWTYWHDNLVLNKQAEKVRDFTSTYLLIGGKLHRKANEPQYSVAASHGFRRRWHAYTREGEGSYNANDRIPLEAKAQQFRADHPDASVFIDGHIEVLVPEAVAEPSHAERTYLNHARELQKLFLDTVEKAQKQLCGERIRWGRNGLEPVDPYIPHCEGCPLAGNDECVVQALEARAQALGNEAEAINAELAERRKRGWNPAE